MTQDCPTSTNIELNAYNLSSMKTSYGTSVLELSMRKHVILSFSVTGSFDNNMDSIAPSQSSSCSGITSTPQQQLQQQRYQHFMVEALPSLIKQGFVPVLVETASSPCQYQSYSEQTLSQRSKLLLNACHLLMSRIPKVILSQIQCQCLGLRPTVNHFISANNDHIYHVQNPEVIRRQLEEQCRLILEEITNHVWIVYNGKLIQRIAINKNNHVATGNHEGFVASLMTELNMVPKKSSSSSSLDVVEDALLELSSISPLLTPMDIHLAKKRKITKFVKLANKKKAEKQLLMGEEEEAVEEQNNDAMMMMTLVVPTQHEVQHRAAPAPATTVPTAASSKPTRRIVNRHYQQQQAHVPCTITLSASNDDMVSMETAM